MKDDQRKSGTLSGKRIVLLGGSSGIGFATAQAAAAEGAIIIIASSNQQRVNEALAQLPKQSTGYAADLTNEKQIQELFHTIGKFDHLVYTAGENIRLELLKDIHTDAAKQYFNVRYWGALTAVKYGAPNIQPGGSIVLTSGIASARPNAGWSLGASMCAAMEGFGRAMARELAPIRVNVVSPGVVKTNLWAGIPDQDREAMYKQIGDSLPVKRVAVADEIAQTYLYLLQQPFSTGQTVIVDGGAVLV